LSLVFAAVIMSAATDRMGETQFNI